jgi:hypothetical protein
MQAQVSSDDSASNALTTGGTRLKHFLDGLHVETRWIAGHHIVWQTGQQNGPSGAEPADHTHCSAFVAVAAMYPNFVLREHVWNDNGADAVVFVDL